MDRWKYFDITHRDHVLCNPLSLQKLDALIALFDLPPACRVLDLACGKAEALVRIVQRWDARAVGVDLSPHCIRDAQEKVRKRCPEADIRFLEQDAAAYHDDVPFDVAMCLGASWAFGGHDGTLRALGAQVRGGGLVVAGEPFWRDDPSPEYLAAEGLSADSFGTHALNVASGVEVGLAPLYALCSSDDDWDNYEGLQWRAAERYAAANPHDVDVGELLAVTRKKRDAYLRWGRDVLGWAVYVFQKHRA